MTQTWQVHCGDALSVLKTLPGGCVDCVVTSQPYFQQRNYGHEGQIGLEESPADYVCRIVEVFAEIWRVLIDEGTCFLNLGDGYCAAGGGGEARMIELGQPSDRALHLKAGALSGTTGPKRTGLKPKGSDRHPLVRRLRAPR